MTGIILLILSLAAALILCALIIRSVRTSSAHTDLENRTQTTNPRGPGTP